MHVYMSMLSARLDATAEVDASLSDGYLMQKSTTGNPHNFLEVSPNIVGMKMIANEYTLTGIFETRQRRDWRSFRKTLNNRNNSLVCVNNRLTLCAASSSRTRSLFLFAGIFNNGLKFLYIAQLSYIRAGKTDLERRRKLKFSREICMSKR